MKYQLLTNDYRSFQHPHSQKTIRVHRIIYMRSVSWKSPFDGKEYRVHDGMLGGYIEKESNLPHDDTSILLNNAMIFGEATISDTIMRDQCTVYDNCQIRDSEIFGRSEIFGKTKAKHCIFRDSTSVGGLLDLERVYAANSTNISGICKLADVEMRVGSIIRGQSQVNGTILTDTSEICGVSTVRNCRLSGRAFLKNANVQNQSFSEILSISVRYAEGDLFPH